VSSYERKVELTAVLCPAVPGPGGDKVEEKRHKVGQDAKQVDNVHSALDKPKKRTQDDSTDQILHCKDTVPKI
jgi:hypothetical protein